MSDPGQLTVATSSVSRAAAARLIEEALAAMGMHDFEGSVAVVDGPGSYAAQLAAVRAALVEAVPFPCRPDDFIRSMEAIEAIRARMPGWGGDGRS